MTETATDDRFYQAFKGGFTSLLKWPDLDAFWEVLRQQPDKRWYVYAIGGEVPEQPIDHRQLQTFIKEMDALLHHEHQEDYCGIVYVDNKTDPSFIKIYDPNNLGVVCGFSDNPPLPGWVLSLIPPKLLDSHTILTGQRQRWWQKIFHRH